MEWGQQMRKHQQVSRDAMYHNSNYTNSRETKIPLILDIEESVLDGSDPTSGQKGLSNSASFSVNLMEPLIIDELSDIYLDSCMTMNCKFGNTQDNMSIVVKIDQFNNNTRSASTRDNQRINNALLIPNEFNNLDKHNEMHLHKGKKMNYVCSINPTKLSQFTGTITDLAGNPIFPKRLHYVQINTGATVGTNKAIPVGSVITVGGFTGEVAVQMQQDSQDLYFYEVSGSVPSDTGTTSYVFTIAAGNITRTAIDNTQILGIYPKMILEFLICNRK